MADNKNLKDELNKYLDEINDNNNFSPEEHFPTGSEFPDLGKMEIIDYEEQITETEKKSLSGIKALAKFYLQDESIISDPYIQYRINQDGSYYATLDWMIKTGKVSMIDIKRQMDNGENGPRMYEVLSMLHKEMRENIKLAKTNLADLQSFYKNIREDVELLRLGNSTESSNPDGEITNHKKLNDVLRDIGKQDQNNDFNF